VFSTDCRISIPSNAPRTNFPKQIGGEGIVKEKKKEEAIEKAQREVVRY